jgi:alpha/beta superfamily hydrolase
MSENLRLEGRFDQGTLKKGVVITHPHPLYGGDMRNPVVEAIQKSFRRCGYATLRFNFRGAGRSQGRYDEGRGERRDVRAAVAAMLAEGVSSVALAGYSFGAWVDALTLGEGLDVGRLVMVSPPTAFIDFSGVQSLPALELVITGDRDEIAPAAQIRPLLERWNPAAGFEVIPGCDHFYGGHLQQLEDILRRHIGR